METVDAQWWFFWMGAVFGFFICASLVMLLPSLRLHGVMVRWWVCHANWQSPFTRAVCGLGRSSSPDAFHGRELAASRHTLAIFAPNRPTGCNFELLTEIPYASFGGSAACCCAP